MSTTSVAGPRVTWEPDVAAAIERLLTEHAERFEQRPLMVAVVSGKTQ